MLQYFDAGLFPLLILYVLNSFPGLILAAVSYGLPVRWLLIPVIVTAVFLLGTHGFLDLASDPQAAIALFFIPFFGAGVALLASALTGIAFGLISRRRD